MSTPTYPGIERCTPTARYVYALMYPGHGVDARFEHVDVAKQARLPSKEARVALRDLQTWGFASFEVGGWRFEHCTGGAA